MKVSATALLHLRYLPGFLCCDVHSEHRHSDKCKISRLGTRRFPELGTTQTGMLAEPQATIFTRLVSELQVSWL